MTIVLREYQDDLLDAARIAALTAKRVCMYGPTGSGKTEVGMTLIDELLAQDKRVTWCAARLDLIQQTSERFDEHGLDHGIVQARHERTDITKPLQIASIQTLNRRAFIPNFDVLIIDEAHGAIAPMYRKFLDAHDVPVFGLTATPFSRGLGKVFNRLVHSTSIRALTHDGWLVPVRYYAPDRPNLSGVRIVAGDYNEADLDLCVNTKKLVGNVVDEWLKRASGRKTICFATSIEHSKNIVEQFKLHRIKAEHIDAYTPFEQRKAIIARLRRGQTQLVSNVAVLAEGFDCPDADCMILARPTRSMIRYLQMVGRVMRPSPGKKDALVLDHSASVETLGFVDDDRELTLDMGHSRSSLHDTDVDPPHVCPKCAYVMRRKVYPCAVCGYQPDRREIEMAVAEGTLKELRRSRLGTDERQVIYSAFVGYALSKGHRLTSAAHLYYAMMKGWPTGLADTPGPMVRAVRSYITSTHIRRAHGWQRREHG